MLQKKLDAIQAFRSQRQIRAVIDIINNAGPVEYIRDLGFHLYSPEIYREMFEAKQVFNRESCTRPFREPRVAQKVEVKVDSFGNADCNKTVLRT